MEENHTQDLLTKLQSLDEPTKRKVLIVSTIVIMVVVLFVWVAYFNSIVIPSASQTGGAVTSTASATPAAPATGVPAQTSSAQSGGGLWKDIKSGFANLFHGGSQTITPTNQ